MSTYTPQPWNLNDLFTSFDAPEVQTTLDQVEKGIEAFEGWRVALTPELSPADLRTILDAYENLLRQLSRLSGYGSLRFAANTQNQQAHTFRARMGQKLAEADNRTMFFKLWWQTLEDGPAERLLAAAGEYQYWLESLRLERPHTLSEAEEKIINLKNVNGVSALSTLYDSIANRYTFRINENGEEKTITRGQLQSYYQNPNPDLRAAAYQELFRVYGQDRPILGQIYQYRVRDWHSEKVTLRHYRTPISVRNLINDVPDEVVETLFEVCEANAPLFHRYFRLKAKWLGVERLRRYDVYAPVGQASRTYTFQEAVDLVLASFRQFDPQMADLAQQVLDEQHLDSEIRPGKTHGAFCATITPDLTPWVLQSYQSRPVDVATLAHELGHAVHSLLAAHHNALNQRASLPLSETASTFGEMLLVDHLLGQDSDPHLQHELLFKQVDDAYATILRQAFLGLFERDAHKAVMGGASVDDLCDLYLENLRGQFGDSLELSDDFRYEWLAISHIYQVPFYVYAYAFGQLLVLSLYEQYRQEGEQFKPRYREILAAGGSVAPMAVLDRAGVNVRLPQFWQGGFEVIANLLTRLEEL